MNETYLIELSNKLIELKHGMYKMDVMQVLGANRAVEYGTNCNIERWFYRFQLANKNNLYCMLSFKEGELYEVKQTEV